MTALAGLALVLSFAAPQQEGNVTLHEDADFARALTLEMGFDNLSEVQLDRSLAKASGGEDRGLLLLTRCDVRKESARRAVETADKLAAYGKALTAYSDFLASGPPSQLAFSARTSLAEVAFEYGSTLKLAMEAGVIPPDKQADERKSAEKLFDGALQSINALIDDYGKLSSEEQDSLKRSVLFPSRFYKALIYYYWGLLYPADSVERKENCRRAQEQLEKFTLDVGETSPAGFRGYNAIAAVFESQNDMDSAESYWHHVIENCAPDDIAEQISDVEFDIRRGIIQESYLGLADAYLKRARLADVLTLGQTFTAWEKDKSVILVEAGYRTLLRYAEALYQSGRFDDALKLTERVARENERSVLRLESNAVTREILDKLPAGASIDLSVLYDAAYGAYAQRSYGEAVQGFQRVLARLGGSSKANDFGGKAYYYLGRSWEGQDRKLEAAACYQQGYELFQEDAEAAQNNVRSWNRLAEQFYNANRSDKALGDFRQASIEAVNLQGGGGDNPAWQAAQNDFAAARDLDKKARGKAADSAEAHAALNAYSKASKSFDGFQKGSRFYEKAWVMRGRCEYYRIVWEPEAAERTFKIFNDYIEVYCANPENNPADAAARKLRRDSLAEATYWRSQVRFKQGDLGDKGAYTTYLKLSDGYPAQYPDQDDFAGGTFLSRIIAFLALDQVDAAEAEFQKLVAAKLSAKWTENAAFKLYQRLQAQLDQTKEAAARLPLLRKAADYLNACNQAAADPSWLYRYNEARLRTELGDSAAATELLEAILRKDANSLSEGDRFLVDLALVEAYLEQDKTGAAQPIIEKLTADPKHKNNVDVMNDAVRVAVGYPVWRDNRLVEVPGSAGTAEDFRKADEILANIQNGIEYRAKEQQVSKYDLPEFWHAKLEQAYMYYRWSTIDAGYRGKNKSLVDSLRRLSGDLGEKVLGPEFRRTLEAVENL